MTNFLKKCEGKPTVGGGTGERKYENPWGYEIFSFSFFHSSLSS